MDITRELETLDLGSKVKRFRLQKQFTLQNLSDITGISKPRLSQIENSNAAPPISSLIKISKALGISVGVFFQDNSPSCRISISRSNERQNISVPETNDSITPGYNYFSLAPSFDDKSIHPFYCCFKCFDEDEMIFYSHPGEEFHFVISGILEMRTDDQVIVLNQGDSIYFDSKIRHSFRSMNTEYAYTIAVLYI